MLYHVYPAVDLFGPARWVHGAAHYENLREDGRYDAFVNAVTVEFRNGGLGQWTWAGGVSIREPEQLTRYVLQRATLRTVEGGWERSDRNGTARIRPRPGTPPTHQERWLEEIRAEDYSAGHADLAVAWEGDPDHSERRAIHERGKADRPE
ncbi:MAG: hypothetical protein KatS3mg115_2060 [Candidatus Poribacteria bacterium]|nr:MAG: hypothetical protein KatS3mg115_2060 [Candidatus Poribacteria bacterium]